MFLREYVYVWFLIFSCLGSVLSRQPRTDCPETMCGNIRIRYPWGISLECAYEERFLIRCDENQQKAFLATKKVEVHSILDEGELEVFMNVSSVCNNLPDEVKFINTGFSYSKKNQLIVLGCNIYAELDLTREFGQGWYHCETRCSSVRPDVGLCGTMGCCIIQLPSGSNNLWVDITNISDARDAQTFRRCVHVFVVKRDYFSLSGQVHLENLTNVTRSLVLLDWTINRQKCHERACAQNSLCFKSTAPSGLGFNCKCMKGYEGNPNLPTGCIDIDECKAGTHSCGRHETCKNVSGSFRCNKITDWKTIILVSIIGLLLFLMGLCCLMVRLKFRKQSKLREKRFEENGGVLLVQRLLDFGAQSSNASSIKIFSEKEIKAATKGYHESRILGRGGQGIVYKGVVSDSVEVAVKRARLGDLDQVGQFINELVLLSQITHPNVVRILGCCLESQVPLIVYEYVSGGTLYENLFASSSLSWSDRLRIATEIAQTLAHLHFDVPVPIIHRDVKAANILLDDRLSAKISDFGASRLIPANREQHTTLVQGTRGYLDPEYLRTSTLSETSDVYSYGVVLMELVTREKAFCFNRPQSQRDLVTYVESASKENRLSELFDQSVVNADNQREIHEVALLAMRCTRANGEERPDMRQISSELQGLRASGQPYESGPSVSGFEIEEIE